MVQDDIRKKKKNANNSLKIFLKKADADMG